ncbi:protein maelstrom homolog [Anopheles stephensi]|uniref:protein maelstrom homolog n=1 Tax=Anopheles stephensi TaxID=30069 RepID=UPI001658AEBF|nr:protein maelstrom homolog [Anopheles stephensi]
MPKRNAFFWFMLEHKKRLEAKGYRFRGVKDVVPLAGKIWEKMDAKERERYAAREVEKKPHPKPAHRSSTARHQSQPIKNKNPPDECKEGGPQLMTEMLTKRLWQAEMDSTIETLDFYLISIEYFCRTDDGVYIPAELGLVKFSLESGVQERLHLLINPGKLPYGCALQAEQHGADTHSLPLPPYALGETDLNGVAARLASFLEPGGDADGNRLPMLFTATDGVPVVESTLRRLLRERIGNRPLYVTTVPQLFYRVKLAVERHMMSMTLFPSLVAAQQIIDTDTFAFTSGISCEYHETHDLLERCALARCIRWAYTIAGNCCKELGVDLLPGKHKPLDTTVDTLSDLVDATADGGTGEANVSVPMDSNLERSNDAVADAEDEPGCSSSKRQRCGNRLDYCQLLEQQGQGEGPVGEPKKPETFNVREMSGRGRGLLLDEYPHLAVMGRGRGRGFDLLVRGRGQITPVRGRGR